MNNGQQQPNNQAPRGPSRPINIRQSQVPQLAQAYQNEMNLARQSTDEQVRAQHFQKAQNIKQILLTYQAQQKARQAQAQQAQVQQAQGQSVAQGQQQSKPPQQQQPAAQSQANAPQQVAQGFPPQQQQQQQPQQQQGNMMGNAAGAAGGAGLVMSPRIQSNSGTPGVVMNQQSPRPTSNNSTPNMHNVVPQSGRSATLDGTQPKQPTPAATVQNFNQVKTRLAEFQKEVEKLEYTKRNYQFTPEQLASMDAQIAKIKLKQQQYETYGVYLKQQLVAQARAKQQAQQSQQGASQQNLQQQAQGLPQLSPQMPMNAAGSQMGTPAASGVIPALPMTAPTPGAAGYRGQPGAQARTAPGPQQQPQQRAPYIQSNSPLAGNVAGPASGPGFPLNQTPGNYSVGTPAASIAGGAGQANLSTAGPVPVKATPLTLPGGTGAESTTAVGTPAGGIPKKGRLASPSNSVATPSKASPPVSSTSGMNLSGITKPSVPSIPISSTIDVKPPTAVTLKPNMNSRPTLMGGTANSVGQILGTPGIVKLPTYELSAGAGESIPDNSGRVLTKRKLNELVNSIGSDEGDGKTNIDGDVEELLLDLADEFILLVTGFACRLAKHRKVELVDVKDIQLHLERNWNIRIPGYSMDEIITTRKWQPTNGYQQKVQGVDIAKSVNGNIP